MKTKIEIPYEKDLKDNEIFVELIDNRGLTYCFSGLGSIAVAEVKKDDLITINGAKHEKHHFIPLKVVKRTKKGYELKREDDYKKHQYLTVNDIDTDEADDCINDQPQKLWGVKNDI